PVAVRDVRSISVTYRLSRPTRYCASRVEAPRRTSRSPVANGSSVPVWPARAPVRFRNSRTIANDEGPAGLSTSTIPDGRSARGGISPARAQVAADAYARPLEELAAELRVDGGVDVRGRAPDRPEPDRPARSLRR